MESERLEIPLNNRQPNNRNFSVTNPASDQTEYMATPSPQTMDSQLPQIESIYTLSSETVPAALTSVPQTVEPILPQINLVYSENPAFNDNNFIPILNDEQIMSTSESLTSTETVFPEIKMVFSDYNDGCEENFEAVAMSSTDEYELASQITESEFLKINAAYLESNLSSCDDFGEFTAVNNRKNTESDQAESEVGSGEREVINATGFCRLGKDLTSNRNEIIVAETVKNSDLDFKIESSYSIASNDLETLKTGQAATEITCRAQDSTVICRLETALNEEIVAEPVKDVDLDFDVEPSYDFASNDLENLKTGQGTAEIMCRAQDATIICRLETAVNEEILAEPVKDIDLDVDVKSSCNGCENNNILSPTQPLNESLSQFTEVYCKPSIIMSPLSKQPTPEAEIAELNLDNKICDKLNPKIQESASSSNREAWKQIPIKQEILEDDIVIDYDNSLTFEPLDLDLKSELQIKTDPDVETYFEKPFKCKQCKLQFSLECSYQLHIMVIHNNTNVCYKCPYKTNKRWRMLGHLRSHTGEKKIRCKICKEFYYPYNEFKHFQTCPKPSRYHCDDCEYTTNTKFYYLRHRQYHTGAQEKCPRCDLRFFDKPAMKKHFKCHTKEKPFQCHICYKRFKMRQSRDAHILACCGRKCPSCDHICINCVDFYEHVKQAHVFTKMRQNMRKHYRQYERILAKNSGLVNVVYHVDPEVVNYDSKIVEAKVEFTENEVSQRVPYSEQNFSPEVVQYNTDYEIVQNVKYELVEGVENCEYNSNCGPMNFGADYDYDWMQNDKLHPVTFTEKSTKCEVEENAMYDLIQNVNCELTEGNEDYTLLCL